MPIDKITLFSLQPPELRKLILKTRHYYQWFHTELASVKKVIGDDMMEKINIDLSKSCWIDCLQEPLLVKNISFPEIMAFIASLSEIIDEVVQEMILLFQRMIWLLSDNAFNPHEVDASNDDAQFYFFMMKNLIQDYTKIAQHLPTQAFSFIKPTTSLQFKHKILLSIGSFDTKVDLTIHLSTKEAFRHAKLIGSSDETEDLQSYSNQLLREWIKDKLQYFPNSKRVISEWIVIAGELFNSVIICDKLTISDMPSVQLSSLFRSNEENTKEFFIIKIQFY